MKITVGKLKALVRESLESAGLMREAPSEHAQDPAENALDAIRDAWYGMHDPGDPSMEAGGGEQAWRKQVDVAIMALSEELHELVQRVETDLFDGQFYGS